MHQADKAYLFPAKPVFRVRFEYGTIPILAFRQLEIRRRELLAAKLAH
jgi:hypothetical protein